MAKKHIQIKFCSLRIVWTEGGLIKDHTFNGYFFRQPSLTGRCQWISSPQKRHRSLCIQLGTFYETRALPIQSRAKVKSWHPGRNRIWLRWVLGFTGGDLRRPGWLLVLSRLGRSSPLTMSKKQLVNNPSPPFQGVWTQSWLSLATSIVWIVLPKVSPIFFCNRILNYTFCSP